MICVLLVTGGTDGAELIRSLLLNGSTGKWLPETEALLMSAARRTFFPCNQPALQRGDVVICDQFITQPIFIKALSMGLVKSCLIALINYPAKG